MNKDCKKALARISKLCRDNISAFGGTYDPKCRPWDKNSATMKCAKAEGNGVTIMAQEILLEIKMIRKSFKKKKINKNLV